METLFWKILIGVTIGALAAYFTRKTVVNGFFGNIISGILGAWLGDLLLGNLGPTIAGIHVLPATIGAAILVLVFYLLFSLKNNVDY